MLKFKIVANDSIHHIDVDVYQSERVNVWNNILIDNKWDDGSIAALPKKQRAIIKKQRDDAKVVFDEQTQTFLADFYDMTEQPQPAVTDGQSAKPVYRMEGGVIIRDWEVVEDLLKVELKIAELQTQLSATDRLVLEAVEFLVLGQNVPIDVANVISERKLIRGQINNLEDEYMKKS